MYKSTILFLSLLGISSLALADEYSGVYMGFQMGTSDLHYDNTSYLLPMNSVDSTKWTGRFYGGYALSEFFATELGYDYYGKPNLAYMPTRDSQTFSQQGVDLVGKVMLPLDYGFGFYLKAGGAWIKRSEIISYNSEFVAHGKSNRAAALIGAGASYAFSPAWSADISWTKSFTNGNLPRMDMCAFGLAYKF